MKKVGKTLLTLGIISVIVGGAYVLIKKLDDCSDDLDDFFDDDDEYDFIEDVELDRDDDSEYITLTPKTEEKSVSEEKFPSILSSSNL